MITFSCHHCSRNLKAKEELAGKRVKCPGCGNVVAVPQLAGAGAAGHVKSESQISEDKTVPPPKPRNQSASIEAQTLPPRANEAGQDSLSDASGQTSVGAGSKAATGAADVAEEPSRELYDFLAPAQEPDELGRLGPFRVLKVLGAGGMGVVYKAEDPQLKRPVALKAMLPTLGASESARKRFLREAQAAAQIVHDHIVSIYQVGEDRGIPFVAMQFLEGEPLDARLKREPRISMEEVLRIGREVAQGLAAAHAKGLIHRDIKPANIWLEKRSLGRESKDEGRVKILDFGLARAAADDAHLTQTGAIVGTPAYMAPEQAAGETVDFRCDLFSLGCVLYRLTTGTMPFQGKDSISTLIAVSTEEPPSPAEVTPDAPIDLSKLVMYLLAKAPTLRPASAQAVADELRDIELNLPAFADMRAKPAIVMKSDSERPARLEDDSSVTRTTRRDRALPSRSGRTDIRSRKVRDDDKTDIEPAPRKRRKPSGKTAPWPWIIGGVGGGFAVLAVLLVVLLQSGTTRTDSGAQKGQPGSVVSGASRELACFRGKFKPLNRVAISPDCKRALVATAGGKIRLWDLVDFKEIGQLDAHEGDVLALAFSGDGQRALSGGMDALVKHWDLAKMQVHKTLSGHRSWVRAVAFCPDGRHIVSGGNDGLAIHWDLSTGTAKNEFALHSQPINCVTVSPTGKLAATSSFDTTIGLIDLTGAEQPRVFAEHHGVVSSVVFSRSGDTLASASADGTARLWRLSPKKEIMRFFPHPEGAGYVALSPDSKLALTAGGPTLRLWDVAGGQLLFTYQGHEDVILAIAFCPDGRRVVSGGKDGTVRFWSLPDH